MVLRLKETNPLFLIIIGLSSWLIPGGGYFLLNEKKRAVIIFLVIVLTFCIGLYVGSIGVIDSIDSKPWYVGQMMFSPVVAVLGYVTAGGGYQVYGRPNEIGQLYTSMAGLLNLLCIVNAVYLAYLHRTEK